MLICCFAGWQKSPRNLVNPQSFSLKINPDSCKSTNGLWFSATYCTILHLLVCHSWFGLSGKNAPNLAKLSDFPKNPGKPFPRFGFMVETSHPPAHRIVGEISPKRLEGHIGSTASGCEMDLVTRYLSNGSVKPNWRLFAPHISKKICSSQIGN